MKKNVCIAVYDISDLGGTNQVASALCYEFVKKYNVTILSIRKNENKLPHSFPENVPIEVLMPQGTKNVKDTTIHCFKPALKYFKNNNTDVVILIGHFVGFILSVLRPFCKTKFVFCDHGALINQWDDTEERIMRKIGTKLSNKLITLTDRTKDDYINLFHLPANKVQRIYNWIDFDQNNTYSYDINCKRIIWAGRFSKEKGNDMMYEIAKKVLPVNPEWHWDVYGDGDTLTQYRNQCQEDGLNGQLHFHGRTNELSSKYKESAIYTMTSYREGLPLVLLEAKANFLPIVSFDVVTGPAEIVNNELDGYLIEQKNTDMFAEKLMNLMQNEDIRIEFSKHSHDNLYKFSKETISNQWFELIDSL